jgi:DNA-binding NtrC family response regulator
LVLVDDDDGSRNAMAAALRRVGYDVVEYDTGEAAVEYFADDGEAAALISDVRMPGIDGYEVLRQSRQLRPEMAILLVTAFGDVDGAVSALQQGADDYLTKPLNLLELRRRVELQLERRLLQQRAQNLEERLERFVGFESMVGRSPAMERVFERVRVVAPAPTTVLIIGESGTGKELIANAIHGHSPRAPGRFVALNCGAIPGEILEAELFGHEKGSFTGAHQRRVGKIEAADGGTLFLDEISELSPDLQVKLLRVLEDRRITRVGGNDEIPVDFRLVAATNRNLEDEVTHGRFRRDLYYRLKVVTIALPALRQRTEDIPLLVNHFIEQFNERLERQVTSVSPALLAILKQHQWPGNVRELRNVVENLVLFARGHELTPEDLPPDYRRSPEAAVLEPGPGEMAWSPRPMAEVERETILRTLEYTSGHRARAAQLLGIGLRTLQRKLKEYGVVGAGGEG